MVLLMMMLFPPPLKTVNELLSTLFCFVFALTPLFPTLCHTFVSFPFTSLLYFSSFLLFLGYRHGCNQISLGYWKIVTIYYS